ncbi:MAG TPA: hypothetical protein VN577_16470 [Terriglobales bacterium]|nr:hypothetical protein [Terriglobales bacterium]
MNKHLDSKLSALFGLGMAAGVAYAMRVRPSLLNWGATEDESEMHLLGDDLAPNCRYRATRAVTINAPVEKVWPWLVQIGQDRAGFYSYSWLENLFLADMRNADEIVPEFQERRVGDTVWLANPQRYGGRARMVVAALEPYRSLALVMPQDMGRLEEGETAVYGCWSFHVRSLHGGRTRLLVRSRAGDYSSLPHMVFEFLVFDPAHFVMERKMMLGIKERAERALAS